MVVFFFWAFVLCPSKVQLRRSATARVRARDVLYYLFEHQVRLECDNRAVLRTRRRFVLDCAMAGHQGCAEWRVDPVQVASSFT